MWKLLKINMILVLALLACFRFSIGADLPQGFERFTDEAIRHLPIDIEALSIRGARGYGADEVTEQGFLEVARFKNLRILEADALGLTDDSLSAIAGLSNLEELSLESNNINGEGLKHFSALKNLKKLNLNFNPLSPDWPERISPLSSLVELHVVVYDRPLDDRVLHELSKLKRLTRLELTDNAKDVTDAGLASLASLKSLTSVNLSEASVTSEGLAQLAALERLQRLRLQNLRGIRGGSLVWVSKLSALQELEISGTMLNRDDLAAVNQLSHVGNLLVWNVSRGNDGLQIEHLDGMTSLRAIRTNELLAPSAIRDLSEIETIEYIGDDLTTISDADLWEFVNLPNLKSLMLDSPLVTDKSLDALRQFKSLRYLCVSDKVNITAQQLETLGRESLTQCQIVARYGSKVFYKPEIER